MKLCPQCLFLKPLAEFSPRSGARSHQLRSWCKSCTCAKAKAAKLVDPEKSRRLDREAHAKRRVENYAAVRAGEIARVNPERHRKSNREWNARNPEYNKQWAREAYRTDEDYRLAINLRGRIRRAVLDAEADKSAATADLLGCSRFWFQIHMATLFKPGMTWENHGEVWEIDHVRPCASFNLSNPAEQRLCFHWTNTQPLFVSENRRKSASYDATSEQSTKEIGSRCCQLTSRR